MAALQNHRGQPLTDADGQVLKVGSTVVDSMFGEGMARGTVPLEKGDRVNVQIDCGSHEEPSKLDDTLVGSSVYTAGRSMAGSLAGLLTLSPTPRPACSKSSELPHYLGRRQQGASKALC